MTFLPQIHDIRRTLAKLILVLKDVEAEADRLIAIGQRDRIGSYIGLDSELAILHLKELDQGLEEKRAKLIAHALSMVAGYAHEYSPEAMAWSSTWNARHAAFDDLMAKVRSTLMTNRFVQQLGEVQRELDA